MIFSIIYEIVLDLLLDVLTETCDACGIVGADLLEVGSEAVHVLVVGQHGVGLSVEEVDVPDAQQSQQDGSVLIQRSGAEMVVLQQREGC